MANGSATIAPYAPVVPLSPYLAIKIAGRIYDLEANFIKNLSVTKQTDSSGLYEFSIVDTFDLSLEKKILGLVLEGDIDLSFQYGWAEGQKSKWYRGTIDDYSPVFLSDMSAVLTLSGTLLPAMAQKHCYSFTGDSPSDIVKQIAAKEGWNIADIDETDPYSKTTTISQGNMESIDFIRQKIEPEATCKGEPMLFYLDSDAEGPQMYFIRKSKYITRVKKNYSFIVNGGSYGSVISFSPQYTGVQVKYAFDQETSFIDFDTNDVTVYNASMSKVKGMKGNADLNFYGTASPDRMKQLMANRWWEKNIGGFEATLTVVGDPTITPAEYINIDVFRPDGSRHFVSGTYLVKDVVDTIEGSYVTEMALVKGVDNTDDKSLPYEELVTVSGGEDS